MSLASDSNESESEYQQIVASQQNFYQDLLNMSPSERQRLGINLNRDSQTVDFESMPMPLTYHINSMMGYSRMMNMMYPGQYDVSRFSTINMNRCGCQQICPPCYLPW